MAQQSQVTSNFRLRRSFGKIKKIIDIPNVIEIQKRQPLAIADDEPVVSRGRCVWGGYRYTPSERQLRGGALQGDRESCLESIALAVTLHLAQARELLPRVVEDVLELGLLRLAQLGHRPSVDFFTE